MRFRFNDRLQDSQLLDDTARITQSDNEVAKRGKAAVIRERPLETVVGK